MKNNLIVLLVGPSGSGKTTIANALGVMYGWKQIASYTTRPPRYAGETGHIFVSDEEFDQLSGIVSYTEFCGHRYCATKKQVEENQLYVVDPAGIDFFLREYDGNKSVLIIEITADEAERRGRMLSRGDHPESVDARIINDRIAFANIKADLTVENVDVSQSCNMIFDFVIIKALQDCKKRHRVWTDFEDCLVCEHSSIQNRVIRCDVK